MARSKNIDYQMMGSEPKFSGPVSRMELIHALNWYNYYNDVKSSRKWILEYMKKNGYKPNQISAYEKSSSKEITQTYCSMARLLNNGAKFENTLDKHIKSIISEKEVEIVLEKKQAKVVYNKPNSLIGDIEEVVDSFITSGYKSLPSIKDIVKDRSSSDLKSSAKYYQELLDELKLISSDSEVKEGYDHLKKVQVNRYIQFIENIITELLQKNINNKNSKPRAPRKKKVKSPDQLTSKMKYQATSAEYNITSISPVKILESSVLFVFNVKYKKLMKYVAQEGQTLYVKGSTIQGFDPEKSFSKTIRKPLEVLPIVMKEAKKPLEKKIDLLKTKSSSPNGRINEQTLLLRSFK